MKVRVNKTKIIATYGPACNDDTILENMRKRGDDYVKLDEVEKMVHFYDETIENSYLPRILYNYKENYIIYI
jgi:pyruvate kinase